MLNLNETLNSYASYVIQKDLILKAFLFSIIIFLFVDILRGQVSEINLLQLMPGLFLGLVCTSFFLLMFFSYFLFRIPFENDSQKNRGTKTIYRFELKIDVKSNFFVYSIGILFMVSNILPISLDSFNSYGEKNLESLWSFDELNSIETTLVILLLNIFQIPVIVTSPDFSQKKVQLFPLFFKDYTFLVCIFSGLLTPTVDVPTQLSFIGVGISLYLLITSIVRKSSLRLFSI